MFAAVIAVRRMTHCSVRPRLEQQRGRNRPRHPTPRGPLARSQGIELANLAAVLLLASDVRFTDESFTRGAVHGEICTSFFDRRSSVDLESGRLSRVIPFIIDHRHRWLAGSFCASVAGRTSEPAAST